MPIRWKVVTKERGSVIIHTPGYELHYKKGTRVKAHENTIGIAVFEAKEQAEEMRNFGLDRLTLKVNAIGRGVRPKTWIPRGNCSYQLDESVAAIKRLGLAKFLKHYDCGWRVPKGTLLYREIEVLE